MDIAASRECYIRQNASSLTQLLADLIYSGLCCIGITKSRTVNWLHNKTIHPSFNEEIKRPAHQGNPFWYEDR